MLKFFYNLAILLFGLAYLPKLLRGKYKDSFRQKLGLDLPSLDPLKEGKIVWLHAVSMGETKAAAALAAELHKRHPQLRIVVSNTTETGHAEAKRLIPDAEAYFFLPIDFSFLMRRLFKCLKPAVLILVESEFWYNLLFEAKRSGCKVALVNGKLSERSAKRFSKLSWFSRRLFAHFDLLCLQTSDYKKTFQSLGIDPTKLFVTGNLKFDMKPSAITRAEKEHWQQELGINKEDFVVVLGSTHEGEEKVLLSAIKPLFSMIPSLKVLIVPRHPDRFGRVAEILSELHISFKRFSSHSQEGAKVVLIDTMGKLMSCFQIAQIGIVAGSFIEGIGGHNLFEPASCGVPVLFGPYVDAQRTYADALIEASAGVSLDTSEVPNKILELYENNELREKIGVNALDLFHYSTGAAKKTLDVLESKSIT